MTKRPTTARAVVSGHVRLKRSLVLRDFLAADVLATALTDYWWQLRACRDSAVIAEIEGRGLAIKQLLWVLLGL
ncbi:MAG: hypothetical protein U1F59_06150 [Candidatus Competibacteraceae bacterium]